MNQSETTSAAGDGETRMYEAGRITGHYSDPDGSPDVGYSVGLGEGKMLWIGEISEHLFTETGAAGADLGGSGGQWFVLFGQERGVTQVLGKAMPGIDADALCTTIAAALAAPTAKGGTEVPAGWKLVPERPTPAMSKAGDMYTNCGGPCGNRAGADAYRAMLAASPPPPAGAAGGGSGDLGALDGIDPHEEAENYEYRIDGEYTTTDFEKGMLEDFAAGLLEKVRVALSSPAPDLGAQGEGTKGIAISRNGPRCPMCGSSWSYDGEREDDPLFCEICDGDPDVEDQRTSDLDAQGEPLGDQPTHPTDPFLKVVVTIKRDDTTTCSLSFGRAAKFPLARAAVLKAIQALQAEIADSDKCPASIASTHDLGARGGLSDWVEEQIEELNRLGCEASDREASANAEGRQTDADFCAGESHAYHEAAGVLMEAIERVSFAPDLGAQGEPVAWAYEFRYAAHAQWQLTVTLVRPPADGRTDLRNIRPLYEAPAAPRTGSGVSAEEIEKLCDRLDRLNTISEPQACADVMDEARLMILALIAQAPCDGGETQGGSAALVRGGLSLPERAALAWLLGAYEDAPCCTPGAVYSEHVTPTRIVMTVDLPPSMSLSPEVAATESRVLEGAMQQAVRVLLIQSGYTGLPLPIPLIPEHPSDEDAMRLIREAAALVETSPVQIVLAERRRQIEEKGWTPEHDDGHDDGSLAMAAACYAAPVGIYVCVNVGTERRPKFQYVSAYPWEKPRKKQSDQPSGAENRRAKLAAAGALILAEIERLDRVTPPSGVERIRQDNTSGGL